MTVSFLPITVSTNKYNNNDLPPQHIKLFPAPHTISNDTSIFIQKTPAPPVLVDVNSTKNCNSNNNYNRISANIQQSNSTALMNMDIWKV